MHKSLNDIKGDETTFVEAAYRMDERKFIPMTWTQVMYMVDDLRKLTFGAKRTTLIPDFDSRPIFFDPKPDDKLPNNSIIVSTSHPYGKHRCLRAFWLEKDKKGDCGLSHVTSAFHGAWNAPKRATKTLGIGYFCEAETNGFKHIGHNVKNIVHDCYGNDRRFNLQPLNDFVAEYGMTLSPSDLEKIEGYKQEMERRNKAIDERQNA